MKLEFHPDTFPQLRALPPEVFPVAMAALSGLVQQPRPQGAKRIPGSGADDWRIRIGEYRFVYEIDDLLGTIRVMHVGHRRESYIVRQRPTPAAQPLVPRQQPPASQTSTGQTSTGQPAAGQTSTGQPAAGQPAAGQPATGQRAVIGHATGTGEQAPAGYPTGLEQSGTGQYSVIGHAPVPRPRPSPR